LGVDPVVTGSAKGRRARIAVFLREPLDAADAAAGRLPPDRSGDLRLLAIVVAGAFCILLRSTVFTDRPVLFVNAVDALGFDDAALFLYRLFESPDDGRFNKILFWAFGSVLCYILLPAALLKAMGLRLRDHGVRWLHQRDLGPYGVLLLGVAPLVAFAATQPSFVHAYPMYVPSAAEPLFGRFAVFECAYMLQFVAVEFFFRGFLLHGVKERAGGLLAILFPLIPYVMVHLGKPPLEALAAVAAGLILGFLSLRSGSIAFGIVLHAAVALSMDLAALWMRGVIG